MDGLWPAKKPTGKNELDVVLTAANYAPQFVTFRIGFNGGRWPRDGAFGALITVKFLCQGRKRPKHPVV